VGISAVKFISKLASDAAKPDGQLVVPVGKELSFLHPMPVRQLWGVGEATHASLEALGVETVGDLAAVPERVLRKRLGSSLAHHLSNLAAAIDPRDVELNPGARSISVEETYETDLADGDDVRHALLRLCDRLSRRLHRAHSAGRTVQLKVRFADFETVSRSVSLENAIDVTPDLWDEARTLLEKVEFSGRGVRLIGIGVSGLIDAEEPRQLSLDSPERSLVAEAAEKVRERFGDDAVLPASVIGDRTEKRGDG
jgi:DNA polymerase-4